MSEATTNPTVPATTEAPKGAGALLKEVQGKTDDKTAPKPAKGKPADAGKKPAKAKPAPKAEETPAEPEGPKVTLDPFKVPAGKVVTLARKDITLDKRLQHRKALQDLGEDGAVTQYADAMKRGAKFPAVKVVQDEDEKGRPLYWLYDGFQRVGAYQVNGDKEVECEVVKGTFADAVMLSLASNGENSVIPRTKDDARRAVFAVLDNPGVFEAIMKAFKGKGGVHRAVSATCNCSIGTVANALDARGVKPKGNKLVKATPKKAPKVKPEATPSIGGAALAPAEPAEVSPAAQLKKDREIYAQMCEYEDARLFAEAVRCIKRVGAIVSRFAMDDEKSTTIRQALAKAGCPISPEFDKEAAKEGKDFVPFLSILEHWPVSDKLVTAFESAEKSLAEEAAKEAARLLKEQEAAEKEAAKGK